MGRSSESMSAVNWVMPSSRAPIGEPVRQRLANPASLPGVEGGKRDLGASPSCVLPDVAGAVHALAAGWVDRQPRHVIRVGDFGEGAELRRGWPPLPV